MKIAIWHGEKHDEATVSVLEVNSIHAFVQTSQRQGGFFTGTHADKNFVFVPWHRVNWIEQDEPEEADAAKEGQEQSDCK